MAHTLRAPHLFDYFAFEEASPVRHEYVGGEEFVVADDTPRHNRIAGNISRLLADRLPAGWLGGEAITLAQVYAGTDLG